MRTDTREGEGKAELTPMGNNSGERAGGVTSRPLDLTGVGLILISTLLFATQGIGAKYGLMGFGPYMLLAIRSVLAAAILIGLVVALRLPFPRGAAAWAGGVALGLLQIVIAGSVLFWALQYLPVGRATIYTSTQPFLIAVAAHFLFPGEQLTRWRIGGLVLGFVGVVVVVLSRGEDLSSTSIVADFAVLGGASVWATGQLVAKRIGHYWHTASLTTVQMVTAALVMPFVVLLLEPNRPIVLVPEAVLALIYLATFGSVGAFFMGFYVIRRYEVSVVGSFLFLQPIFAVIMGALLFGERVTWGLLFGLALISVGLVLINRPARKAAPAPAG